MWINIEVIPQDEEAIYLPQRIAERFKTKINIAFAKRVTTAIVKLAPDNKTDEGQSFENPLKIMLSHKLALKLQLLKSLTYQMKFNEHTIFIGPVIGLLLGRNNYLYSPFHMEKYSDRFGIYNKVGGLIYAFSPETIDWKNSVAYGLYYNSIKNVWQFGRFPLPTVIYRRDFHSKAETTKKLIKFTNAKMFNSCRFTKFVLFKYINKDKDLSEYLPPTELSTDFEQVKSFINKYNNVILKPIGLSRGRGICIIKKDGNYYNVSDYRNPEPIESRLAGDEALKGYLKENKGFFDRYLIQRHLSLAKVDGSPFDIRAVMQKERPPEWKCTGIECRVAAPESLVTNISRGGYALTIDEALKGALPECSEEHGSIKLKLDNLCHKLCESLDRSGHHFAEFGVDIAIDEDKKLWIIEVNVFPSFKGFKEMDYDTYLKIRHTPISYAAYLAGF